MPVEDPGATPGTEVGTKVKVESTPLPFVVHPQGPGSRTGLSSSQYLPGRDIQGSIVAPQYIPGAFIQGVLPPAYIKPFRSRDCQPSSSNSSLTGGGSKSCPSMLPCHSAHQPALQDQGSEPCPIRCQPHLPQFHNSPQPCPSPVSNQLQSSEQEMKLDPHHFPALDPSGVSGPSLWEKMTTETRPSRSGWRISRRKDVGSRPGNIWGMKIKF